MKKQETTPTQATITRAPFPASKKIYVEGKIHQDIRVPMREISLTDTKVFGTEKKVPNQPVTVYDTSGAYTDTEIEIDVRKGLEPIREQWIQDREDVKALEGITSDYGKERLANENLDAFRFQHLRKPLVAKGDTPVTQMYYAKQGIITPEMEYVAIRENQKLQEVKDRGWSIREKALGP